MEPSSDDKGKEAGNSLRKFVSERLCFVWQDGGAHAPLARGAAVSHRWRKE